MAEIKTVKRLTGGIATLVTLALCLCLTTFALVYAGVSVDNNLFGTAEVKINLNDGQPLIRENDLLFEPGMTVKKIFSSKIRARWMSTIKSTSPMCPAGWPMC